MGSAPTLTHGALHGPGYSGDRHFNGTYDLGEAADARYHVYAVEWTPDELRWSVDGNTYFSLSRAQVEARGRWAFDQPFFLLLNVAVGGDWPGSPDAGSVFPQRMYVDWVRVYDLGPPRLRRNGAQPLAPPGVQSAAPGPQAGQARPAAPSLQARPAPATPAPQVGAGQPRPTAPSATPSGPIGVQPAHRPLLRLGGAAAPRAMAGHCDSAREADGDGRDCASRDARRADAADRRPP